MPTLKQVTCSLELGPGSTKLKEYGHRYTDGGVEAFVAVPDADIPFSVHVTSTGYIAPGLSVWVFIDGQYQCNRNQHGLQLPTSDNEPSESQIDFHFRQKEENTSNGVYVGREWNFTQLRKASADKGDGAPSLNKEFAENVGTIEVVVRRCEDGPVFAAIANSGSVSKSDTKKSAQRLQRITEENSPSKAPSEVLFKPASTRKASVAGEDMLGGMFGIGLFDGAGDAPGYGQYDPLLRHRDVRPNMKYDRESHDDRRHTVHGDRRRPNDLPVYHARPQASAGLHAQRESQVIEHHAQYRPRHFADQVSSSPQTLPSRLLNDYAYRQDTRMPEQRFAVPSDQQKDTFDFIIDLANEMEAIYRRGREEKLKCNDLQREVEEFEADPTMCYAAMKAYRRQEQKVQRLDEEMHSLVHAALARMGSMNQNSWRRARDLLVVERGLLSADHPGLQRWQDCPAQPLKQTDPRIQEGAASRVEEDADWQELGEFRRNGSGWQKVDQQSARGSKAQSQRRAIWVNDGGRGAENTINHQQNNSRSAGGGDGDQRQPSNAGWDCGDANDNQQGDGGGWDNKAPSDNNAWGDENKSNNLQSPNNVWNNADKDHFQNDQDNAAWGENNDNDGADNWGGTRDETRSQGHQSKVQEWNDGSKAKTGGGRGAQSDSKSQAKGSNWSSAPAAKAVTASTTTHLRPVIKPYWTNWDKPDEPASEQRRRPRDPYQYPAPAAPTLPSRKTKGVKYGVQVGKGAEYAHKAYNPEYIDPMENPYAVFTFKYRSKAEVEKTLKRKIDDRDIRQAVKEVEREKLMRQPKDELVQQMMKMKLGAGNVFKTLSNKPASTPRSAKADDWGQQSASNKPASTNDWGRAASKASVKSAGGDAWSADQKSQPGNAKHDGWDDRVVDKNGSWGGEQTKSASKKSQIKNAWGSQKTPSNATPNHFGAGDNLQKTKSQKTVPRDEGWVKAGW